MKTNKLRVRGRGVSEARRAVRVGGIWLLTFALVSCKTSSPSQYVSPRVTGRVLDAQTRQPIQDVRVRRVRPGEGTRPLDPPKGAQLLAETPPVLTRADGTFVLESVRDLAVFRRLSWYSVSLSFERAGYERLVATYTLGNSTNTAKGEPLVLAGDICLQPLSK